MVSVASKLFTVFLCSHTIIKWFSIVFSYYVVFINYDLRGLLSKDEHESPAVNVTQMSTDGT